ncbi:MAG: hypothetical protein K2P78_12990 [Gemmataceae bacterium]|nr:hypothetical protein [Gemmataceae bacterium]
MRKRLAAAGLGLVLHLSPAAAQYPLPPQVPPGVPVLLPPANGPTPPVQPPPMIDAPGTANPYADLPLPFPEERFAIDANAVMLKRVGASWQVWAGPRVLKDLGPNEDAAKEVVRVIRDLRPTEWCAIGSPRPVVEYGLTNGKPILSAAFPKTVVPIDLLSARVDLIKGVWCLRDDENILFNFGPRRPDAEQALAVVRKYGFNRIGTAGHPQAPALVYFYATPEAEKPQRAAAANSLPSALQEQSLVRTGIPVPGVGYVGEMVRIDPRKVEARKDGYEWVVAHGPDVFARFGAAEFLARDAARVIQDGRFTEFCRFGTGGLTFFLVNGKAPTRVPFAAQGRRFDPTTLRVSQLGDRWAVTEGGRHLFDVTTVDEGETLIRVVKAYQFDQLCQVGQVPRASLFFLARVR